MKTTIKAFFSTLLLFFSITIYAGTPPNTSLAPMLKRVLPAVVNIRAMIRPSEPIPLTKSKENKDNNQDTPSTPQSDKTLSVASGVIVDANKGYILTNAHVIDDAEAVMVILGDGHHYNAKIIGADKASDIALIQIQAKNLTSIPIADSNTLKVGDFVAAIGNPFGLNQTVTSGIVSALGRTTLGIESYENFIQTDAPINPGNSGGALINMDGQLVGINTAILAPDKGSVGIGFAIPTNMVKSVMQQLIEFGNVHRGTLGVGAQDITPDLATAFNLKDAKGAVITLIMAKSPAEQAGLKVGDVITAVNGSEIKNANDVVNTVGFLRVDSRINIDVLRNDKPLKLTATLVDPRKRSQENQSNDPYLYGMALKDFTIYSPFLGDVKGVLVVSVDEDSNAWHSDLRAGDIITSANHEKINNLAELRKVAGSAKDKLLLNILRGSSAFFLVVSKDA